MYVGNEAEWYPRLEAFAALPHKHKIFVPGNHDRYFELYPGPCIQEMKKRGIEALTPTRPRTEIEGVTFGGLPFVKDLENWAYNSTEENIAAYLEHLTRVDVLISHSPPAGVMDGDGRGHYGLKALRRYVAGYQPKILICGHVHEGYGTKVVHRTHCYNAAMCNANYDQVNAPHVIEV